MAYNPGYVDAKQIATNANYVSGAGLFKVYDTIEGGVTFWVYLTSDTLAATQVSGYVTDATAKRLKVGDIVDVFSGTFASQGATATTGLALGAVTFPATVGLSSLFTAQPQYQRMIVTAVTAGTTTTSGVGTWAAAEPAVIGLGNLPRNLIDCGDFTTNPWQLATSFNGSGAAPSLTADRWNANSGTSQTWTAGRTSNTTIAGFSAAYCWGRSVGDTHTVGQSFGQVIESLDSIRVQGLPVALSWYAASDANFAAGASGGTYTATIVSGTGVDESSGKMFSGAWSGMTTIATQAYTPTSTMARIGPLGGTVPTGASQLGVMFSYVPTTAATSPGLTAGAHESLQFMGIQLEAGGVTPFEHTEVAEVVNIATRYLQVIAEPTSTVMVGVAGYNGASSTAQVHIPLASPMRKAPTLTFTPGGYAIIDLANTAHTITSGGLAGATTGAVTLNVTAATTMSSGNSGAPAFLQGRSTNSGIIILSADY